MNEQDLLSTVAEQDMQQAVYRVYSAYKGDRLAYKTAIEELSMERMPDAPEHVRDLFIEFALDVYDGTRDYERAERNSQNPTGSP